MKNHHPATEKLRSLMQLHCKEVGKKPLIALAAPAEVVGVRIQPNKPLDLSLDGESFGHCEPGPVLGEAERSAEALALFEAMNAPEEEEEP